MMRLKKDLMQLYPKVSKHGYLILKLYFTKYKLRRIIAYIFIFYISANVYDASEETILPRARLPTCNKRHGEGFNVAFEKRVTIIHEAKENDTNEIKENDSNETQEVRRQL